MSNKLIKLIMISATLAAGSAGIARADCESDLTMLEKALAAPGLKPDAKAVLDAAGVAGAAAMKKDDDATCNKAVMDGLAKAGIATAPAAAAVPASVSIGDLSPLKAIAADALKMVQGGNNAGAKTRIKDLETAWDKSGKAMKAANIDKWNALDKVLDTTFKSLRAASPKSADSTAVLQTLIALMDRTT
jgi:hypothetical protein